jgi:hypothetical protein
LAEQKPVLDEDERELEDNKHFPVLQTESLPGS